MKLPKFILKQDWNIETEFAGIKSKSNVIKTSFSKYGNLEIQSSVANINKKYRAIKISFPFNFQFKNLIVINTKIKTIICESRV